MKLELQLAGEFPKIPGESDFQRWIKAVEERFPVEKSVVVRVVDENESAALNQRYRNKPGATNVLSFPFVAPDDVDFEHLGDLVICAPVVVKEAIAQKKSPDAHWAHMVIHGILHLLGYDHQSHTEADEMEQKERQILDDLGYPDPYLTDA